MERKTLLPVTDDTIRQIHRNLVEFGYSTVTLEFVKKEVASLLEGNPPKNIIGKFVEKMLKENGYLE